MLDEQLKGHGAVILATSQTSPVEMAPGINYEVPILVDVGLCVVAICTLGEPFY